MRNGSGVMLPVTNSWNPQVNGVNATGPDFNQLYIDLLNALTQSVSADGQTPITGNIQMGNNKLTGLSAGSGTGDSLRWQQLFDQGVETDVASAATTDIGIQNTNFLRITGTTGITSFGTNYRGPRFLRFSAVLTLTNSATLVLPGAADITTDAGATAIAYPIGDPAAGWIIAAYRSGAQGSGPFVSKQGDSMIGALNFSRTTIAATATTTPLWTQPNGNIQDWTGTPTITDFPAAAQAGSQREIYPSAGTIITNAGNISVQGGANYTTATGDKLLITAVTTTTFSVQIIKKSGKATVSASDIEPINVAMAANAATITINPTSFDLRSPTLTNGAVFTSVIPAAISTVISSGSTGGTQNTIAARILVLAIFPTGLPAEVAWVNQSCGLNLDETGVITTVAEGGAGAADSATIIYSTTARANVPFRIAGFFDSTQAVAGTWVTAASKIQGSGGEALKNIDTRIWQSPVRALNTNYTNSSGGTIEVNAVVTASGAGISVSPVVNGFVLPVSNPVNAASFQQSQLSFTVKNGEIYQITASGGATVAWSEKRYT